MLRLLITLIVIINFSFPVNARMVSSQTECQATDKKFEYSCHMILIKDKSPLLDYKGLVIATMPSMAMAHNVPPVSWDQNHNMSGHYHYKIQLEMYGIWLLTYDTYEPVRDRIMEKLHFSKNGSHPVKKTTKHSHGDHSNHEN
jgi:hypothetical protein